MERRYLSWMGAAVLGAAWLIGPAAADPPLPPEAVAQIVSVSDLHAQAGQRLRFIHAPSPPLPERSGGHFDTSAEVVGFDEVGD